MGVVPNCKICHHRSWHGSKIDQLDPKFKSKDITGTDVRTKCQVPIRIPIPNQPGTAMMVPCGCEGDLNPDATPAPEPVVNVMKPPPTCFLPGCTEFAMPNSSFCSNAHTDAMLELVNGNQDQSSPQGRVHSQSESGGDERAGLRGQGAKSELEGESDDEETSELRPQRQEVQALDQTDSGLYLAPVDLDKEFFDNLFNEYGLERKEIMGDE